MPEQQKPLQRTSPESEQASPEEVKDINHLKISKMRVELSAAILFLLATAGTSYLAILEIEEKNKKDVAEEIREMEREKRAREKQWEDFFNPVVGKKESAKPAQPINKQEPDIKKKDPEKKIKAKKRNPKRIQEKHGRLAK